MSISVNLLTANDSTLDVALGTWAAGSNTTVARVTTPTPRTGAGALRLTSTAAGTMTAFTGMYAVSPSTLYEAIGYAKNAVAAAGRVVQISIDWWTSANAYISSSVTTTTLALPNSTAWSGPAIVLGTSPSNAAKASLVITMTAGITAGAQQILFDDFGLGVPVVVDGNLLPYAVSSVEMDTSGWSASNGTLTRGSASAVEGSYNLTATSTAAGDMPVATTARVAVAEGAAYEMYPWVRPPAAGRSLILDILWYDADVGGTLLGTSTRTATTVQTTLWERHTVLGTAPAGATHAAVRIRPQALAAAEAWLLDEMVLRVQPLIAGNLLPYSAQSVEVDASDWVAAGNCTIAQSAPDEEFQRGAYSLKVTCTAVGQARVELASAVPVVEGEYYNAQTRYFTVGAAPESICWMDIDWYDASMVYLGSAEPDQDSTQPGDTWAFDTIGRKAPPGAAFAKVVMLPQATVASQVFYLDQMELVAGPPPYIVEAQPDTGSVTITLQNLDGVATVSLYRVDPDGTLAPVRGFGSDVVDYAVTGDIMVFEDYEPPLGVVLRYEFVLDGDSTTRTYSVTVDPPADRGYVWLTSPGEPARNMLVMVAGAPNWKRTIERGIYRVRGASRPVVVSDVRADREGDLSAVTFSEDDAQALHYLLDEGTVLLIRARPGWGLDKVYVSVGDVSEERVSVYGPQWARRWTLPLTVVDRPVGGMAGSFGRSWQDVLDDVATPTWADVSTTHSTWLDVLQGG